MHFVRTSDSTQGQGELIASLIKELAKGQVLWLISGGSNIAIEIEALNNIAEDLTKRLNILLVDERYGPKGHQDSNFHQLISKGLNIKKANFPDILAKNLPPKETKRHFTQIYEHFKSQSEIVISNLGIGEDGHIAGVLPNSPAVYDKESVVYYESEPFRRLTLSLETLKDINKAFVFCFGNSKRSALERLKEGHETISSLPSLILTAIPDVTVYNDQL